MKKYAKIEGKVDYEMSILPYCYFFFSEGKAAK